MPPLLLLALLGQLGLTDGQDPSCSNYTYNRCYGTLGCFDDCYPFDEFPYPATPENVDSRFFLHTSFDRDYEDHEEISSLNPGQRFDGARARTFLVIHDRGENRETSWVVDMVGELQRGPGEYNVIVLDWSNGATSDPLRPLSPVAAGNTRMVAVQSFLLVETLRFSRNLTLSDFQCIGFGHGAHACGFIGKRYSDEGEPLYRVSGLDPSNGIFVRDGGHVEAVRIAADDGDLVDIIHTNAFGTLSTAGINFNAGDVDFWPHRGESQPSCLVGLNDGCSHRRATALWLASVNMCSFPAKHCPTYDDMRNGNCVDCQAGDMNCQRMGFTSDLYPGRGTFSLKTKGRFPHC